MIMEMVGNAGDTCICFIANLPQTLQTLPAQDINVNSIDNTNFPPIVPSPTWCRNLKEI